MNSRSDVNTITLRKPDILDEEAPIIWSEIPEFSLIWNGASVIIPFVEHYLNKVVADIRDHHCHDAPELKEELDMFIRQEANHALYHMKFNKRMFDAGYCELQPVIDRMKAELKVMRVTKSLAFNIAYCAGFENAATFSAKYLLTQADDLFAGADYRGANIFLWHVAEEFEHRAVCHNAWEHVSGGYFTRLHGLFYSLWHINSTFNRAANVVLEHYRKDMTPKALKISIRAEKQLKRRQAWAVFPQLIRLLSPGFNPANLPVPVKIQNALDFFNEDGKIEVLWSSTSSKNNL